MHDISKQRPGFFDRFLSYQHRTCLSAVFFQTKTADLCTCHWQFVFDPTLPYPTLPFSFSFSFFRSFDSLWLSGLIPLHVCHAAMLLLIPKRATTYILTTTFGIKIFSSFFVVKPFYFTCKQIILCILYV